MQSLSWTVVVKREFSPEVKLSVYRSVCVPTLTYDYELLVIRQNESLERLYFWLGLGAAQCAPRGTGGSCRRQLLLVLSDLLLLNETSVITTLGKKGVCTSLSGKASMIKIILLLDHGINLYSTFLTQAKCASVFKDVNCHKNIVNMKICHVLLNNS